MDRVYKPREKPVDDMGPVAVAISEPSPNQRHIGILHRDPESGQTRMLHLEWHLRLSNGLLPFDYLWIDPAIPSPRLVQVAANCRRIWRANQAGRIPYGFSVPSDCFAAETGEFLLGPTRHGLTCATFVLAVFHYAGIRLVDYASWPVDRPGDREWQQKIVSLLQDNGASSTHLQAIQSEVGSVRFRPEETAGAATQGTLPVDFDVANALGLAILEKLKPINSSEC